LNEDAMTDLMPDDALFHGTSTPRWRSIQQSGVLRLPTSGDLKISLTTDRGVAEYFADLAAWTDRTDRLGDGPGVIIVLSRSALEASGHRLTEFRDDFWGDGECDWEEELACWSDIDISQVTAAHQLDAATV
jgi:hypothetical protein